LTRFSGWLVDLKERDLGFRSNGVVEMHTDGDEVEPEEPFPVRAWVSM
jgi:hypothetical protein